MSDEKFVVLVVGELGDNVRHQRWLKLLQELHGDKIEIVRQSGDEINGMQAEFILMDELYSPVVPVREVHHHSQRPMNYWQRGRWGQ